LRAAAGDDIAKELLALTQEEIRRVQRRGMLLAMNARQRLASFLLEMSERLDQPHILELPMPAGHRGLSGTLAALVGNPTRVTARGAVAVSS